MLPSDIADDISDDSGFSSLNSLDSSISSTDSSEILQEFEKFKIQKNARIESFSKGKMSLKIYSYGQSSQSENNLKTFLETFFFSIKTVVLTFFV